MTDKPPTTEETTKVRELHARAGELELDPVFGILHVEKECAIKDSTAPFLFHMYQNALPLCDTIEAQAAEIAELKGLNPCEPHEHVVEHLQCALANPVDCRGDWFGVIHEALKFVEPVGKGNS